MKRRSFFFHLGAGVAATVASPSFSQANTVTRTTGKRSGRIPFQLGFAGYTFYHFNLDKSLEMIQKVDVHYLCIKDFHLPLDSGKERIRAFHEKCAKFGVTGYGVGPIYMGTRQEAKQAFDYARRVGVKLIVGVPFEWRTYKGRRCRCMSRGLLEYVDKLCKESDIKYAIHNHGPDMPELFPNAASVGEMIKGLDGRIGYCLDIGHEFRDGGDPVKAIHACGERLFDLHLKNVTDSTRAGRAIELPRGKIDLPAVARALCDIGYTGKCSLEYEKNMRAPFPGIVESIGYFRGILDTLR